MKDQLFLLKPGFSNADKGPLYCGDSVAVEGLLGFFPSLREKVDVHYIDFPRPRAGIVALIGAENQSVPVLVLNSASEVQGAICKTAHGKNFIDDEAQIRSYLSLRHGVATAG
jgi:hypothetical protein